MKYLAATVLLAILLQAHAGDNKKKAMEVMSKCKEQTGATEDVEKMFDELTVPETREGKCLMACAAKVRGVMKDGKIDVEAATEHFQKVFADDPEFLKKGIETLQKCGSVDVSGKDECEAAAAYAKCGKENGFRI